MSTHADITNVTVERMGDEFHAILNDGEERLVLPGRTPDEVREHGNMLIRAADRLAAVILDEAAEKVRTHLEENGLLVDDYTLDQVRDRL